MLSTQVQPQPASAQVERVASATTSVMELIEKHGANLTKTQRQEIYAVVMCESDGVPQQSKFVNAKGERERSFGISQIHLPSHPAVTYEQAMDNDFAIRFMVDKWKRGEQGIWTCYKKLLTSK